VVDLDWW